MRVHVGRIGYRVSDKLSKVLPSRLVCVHSPVNAKLAVIRELPVRVGPSSGWISLSWIELRN